MSLLAILFLYDRCHTFWLSLNPETWHGRGEGEHDQQRRLAHIPIIARGCFLPSSNEILTFLCAHLSLTVISPAVHYRQIHTIHCTEYTIAILAEVAVKTDHSLLSSCLCLCTTLGFLVLKGCTVHLSRTFVHFSASLQTNRYITMTSFHQLLSQSRAN